MLETFNAQLSELATRASSSATLEEAATLRQRGNRRIWRRRGGGALLGVAAAVTAVTLGLSMTGGNTTPQATAVAQTSSSPTSAPTASTPRAQVYVEPLPTSRGTLSAVQWAHKVQIYEQLRDVNSYSVGDSTYAVITKADYYDCEVKFYAGAHSTTDVNQFGATWVQVVAGHLERGFTNVTIRTQASSTLPTDAVIDVQNSAGVSVLGQRIPLTTPIVLIAAS